MPIAGSPFRDRHKSYCNKVFLTMFFPISPRIRMAVQSLAERDDGITEFSP